MAIIKTPYEKRIVGEIQTSKGYIRRQAWTAPVATSNTAVHAAVTLPTSGTTVVTTAITNPDFPRNLIVKGNASGITGNVVIAGTNIRGAAITETIVAVDATAVAGNKAFKTVTSITVPVRTTAGDTISIGVGVKLGLDRMMAEASVLAAYTNQVLETTAPTVANSATAIESNTILTNTAPNASRNFVAISITTEKTTDSSTTA